MTAMPYEKRVSLYNSVLNQIEASKQKGQTYRDLLPDFNIRLTEFYEKFQEQKEKLVNVEAERCEQVHSAIGQFVVFEKNAEMTNKYDIKNFADIIDKFNVEDEIKLILENVDYAMEVGRLPLKQTVFDPVIKMEEKQNSCYEFIEYVPKKYNIHEMPEKDDKHLINQPPLRL